MNAQWVVDRRRLRTLLSIRPDWTLQDLADAIGRSRSWVKKWVARLRQAAPSDDTVLQGRECARHTPPPRLSHSPYAVKRTGWSSRRASKAICKARAYSFALRAKWVSLVSPFNSSSLM